MGTKPKKGDLFPTIKKKAPKKYLTPQYSWLTAHGIEAWTGKEIKHPVGKKAEFEYAGFVKSGALVGDIPFSLAYKEKKKKRRRKSGGTLMMRVSSFKPPKIKLGGKL
jgi:hypothetical protein